MIVKLINVCNVCASIHVNIYIYKHIAVSLLYTDMVKLNTQTPQDSPYTFLQTFIMAREFFWGKFLPVLPRLYFSGSSFCAIINEQLKFQFINSSDTSRSRFVMAFCPCSTTHFSGKPAANDSFGSIFDFALPHV